MAELFDQNKAVEKKQDQAITKLTEPIPGLEDFGQEDLIVPRLKVLQGLSAEVADGIAPMGSIVNSLTKDVVAKVKDKKAEIEVIPIKYGKYRLRFAARELGGQILCRSNDAKTGEGDPGGDCATCPFAKWGKDETGKNKAPECTLILNVLAMVRGYDFPIPIAVPFARTSMPAGRQFANLMFMRQRPVWEFAYKLATKFENKKQGQYYIWEVKPAGESTKQEQEQARGFYEMLKTVTVQVHEEPLESEVDDSGNTNPEYGGDSEPEF
ncbi:MAG: hypothetical protein GXO75_19030 [Calditrichaeota bacterium]|nr:hypothetical protein [Calditrichota bacterium]